MSLPAFRGATAASAASTGISLAAPGGTASGDYQLVIVQWSTATETVVVPPSGWQLLADTGTGDGSNPDKVQYYESTTATGAFALTKSGSSRWTVIRAVWNNTAGRVGSLATFQVTTSTTSHPTPLVTPPSGEYLVVGGVSIEEDSAATSYTPPNGWTERMDFAGGTTGDVPSSTIADVPVTAGQPTLGVFLSSLPDQSATFALVLAPTSGRPALNEFDFDFDLPTTSPYVRWGQRTDSDILVEKFDPGTIDVRSQDKDAPMGDAVIFGTDRRTPPTWQFTCSTNGADTASGLALAETLSYLWDAENTRLTPGSVMAMRYRMGGRTRRVYGRPRQFSVVPTTTTRAGKVTVVCNFRLAEPVYYDDTLNTVPVRINSSSTSSGFTFPVTFPLIMRGAAVTVGSGQAIIGGSRPTWLTIQFFGPVTDPAITIGSLKWALRGTLTGSQSVTLTGIPWNQGIQRNDGVYVPQMLDPRSRLSQLRMSPGSYAVSMTGFDPTGSAYAFLSWRNAYSSL